MIIKVITHFHKDDEDCTGDYSDIELFIDNELVRTWGDYYHDKGDIAVDAFIEGVKYASNGPWKIVTKNVSDREH